ncbi:MAG: cyanophycin synthetase, partial [Pseudomonadota bacterium]
LNAIKRQFHHLVRTIPSEGLIVWNQQSDALKETLDYGCWSHTESFVFHGEGAQWWGMPGQDNTVSISFKDQHLGEIQWSQLGAHNAQNAIAAIAAARHAGVPVEVSLKALKEFKGVSRRLEIIGRPNGITVYDDFAHHPTAVAATLSALKDNHPDARIVTLLEPRSNTMRMGIHAQALKAALSDADRVMVYMPPNLEWNFDLDKRTMSIHDSVEDIIQQCRRELKEGDQVVVMSNGGFDGIHKRLVVELESE